MGTQGTHKICIHEYPFGPTDDTRRCRVRIAVDGIALPGSVDIVDPFEVVNHQWLGKYLEDALEEYDFNKRLAGEIEEDLHHYRKKLFAELRLHLRGFQFSCVKLNVFAYASSDIRVGSTTKFTSILNFYWELLELIPNVNNKQTDDDDTKEGKRRRQLRETNIWPENIVEVTVCRIVQKVSSLNEQDINIALHNHSVPQPTFWFDIEEKSKKGIDEGASNVETPTNHFAADGNDTPDEVGCRVLLVVARKPAGTQKYEPSPSFIEQALLELFVDLNKRVRKKKYYSLEVVRPGSYNELRAVLNGRGIKNYQMVHFDMHGIVTCTNPNCGLPRSNWRPFDRRSPTCSETGNGHGSEPRLMFASISGDGNLNTENVRAARVARLLRKNDIHCVALNACESARTADGHAGNLSSIFVQQGISAVVAMSFQISDEMFVRFYKRFYRRLFQHGEDVSVAASEARKYLLQDRVRLNPAFLNIEMNDWFVPVTYCDGSLIKIYVPETMPQDDEETSDGLVDDEAMSVLERIAVALAFACFLACFLEWFVSRQYPSFRLVLLSCALIGVLILWAGFERLLGVRYLKVLEASEIQCEVLDHNMLNIENSLKQYEPTILHGLEASSGSLSLIDNLTCVWVGTGFIDFVIVIKAAWFYQPRALQEIRRWYCEQTHRRQCCHGDLQDERRRNNLGRQVFVVTDLEKLFPQETSLLQISWQNYAQRRFREFLRQNFRAGHQGDNPNARDSNPVDVNTPFLITAGGTRPFLLLSGNTTLPERTELQKRLENDFKVLGFRLININKSDTFRTIQIQQHSNDSVGQDL